MKCIRQEFTYTEFSIGFFNTLNSFMDVAVTSSPCKNSTVSATWQWEGHGPKTGQAPYKKK